MCVLQRLPQDTHTQDLSAQRSSRRPQEMVQIKKELEQAGCGPVVGRLATRNPLAGPPSLSDCLERAESVQPSGLAVKGGTWHNRSQGEAHLATLRKARAEAREARMREVECKQRELDRDADRVFEVDQLEKTLDRAAAEICARPPRGGGAGGACAAPGGTASAPRMQRAVEQLATCGELLAGAVEGAKSDLYESYSAALQEVRDCYRAEREELIYEVELLKDSQTESEEAHSQLQREHREKCKELDATKRDHVKIAEELRLVQGQLAERDELLSCLGYMIVTLESDDGTDACRALVGTEHGRLPTAGTLDDFLIPVTKEKEKLEKRLDAAQQELQELQTKMQQLGLDYYGELLQHDELQWQDVKEAVEHYKNCAKQKEKENYRLHNQLIETRSYAEKSAEQFEIDRQKLLREPIVTQFWDECHCQ
ncbi:leucine-rich repeat flightless-interacting protein 2-like isoform X2 [Anopheles aquasalis]|uniref:leucine-rich repeat flightless-interacting protein 2-like isoform X2 n=1 Tax=Anopheles aquasalis TaxID=42839 RepID=UPI00215B1359|nr:leucine-rich repeat flightless-interacting protein 2-like isoform X2 [Anopheles aquasalis]